MIALAIGIGTILGNNFVIVATVDRSRLIVVIVLVPVYLSTYLSTAIPIPLPTYLCQKQLLNSYSFYRYVHWHSIRIDR